MDRILKLLSVIEKSKYISFDDNEKVAIKGVYLSNDTNTDFKNNTIRTTVTIYTSGKTYTLKLNEKVKWAALSYTKGRPSSILITYPDGYSQKIEIK